MCVCPSMVSSKSIWPSVTGTKLLALGLFGVGAEAALALVLIVEMANFLSVAAVGAMSLWAQGVALGDVSDAKGPGGAQA